jgi:hypothetical protein
VTTGSLSASLVWNLSVTGETANGFDTSASLYHLGLYLYDITSGSQLAYAASSVDNTENIWWNNLLPNHAYLLKVTAEQADFLWDYALAWNITALTTSAPESLMVDFGGSESLAAAAALVAAPQESFAAMPEDSHSVLQASAAHVQTPVPPAVYLLGSGLVVIFWRRRKAPRS